MATTREAAARGGNLELDRGTSGACGLRNPPLTLNATGAP